MKHQTRDRATKSRNSIIFQLELNLRSCDFYEMFSKLATECTGTGITKLQPVNDIIARFFSQCFSLDLVFAWCTLHSLITCHKSFSTPASVNQGKNTDLFFARAPFQHSCSHSQLIIFIISPCSGCGMPFFTEFRFDRTFPLFSLFVFMLINNRIMML